MAYVDGFVLPVPKDKLDAYRKLARKAGKIWKEYGALEYVECVADDVQPGKLTSFPQAVKLKPDEVVVFSWIVYASRAQRDKINAKVMADPRHRVDGSEEYAFRRQTHVLGRLQAHRDDVALPAPTRRPPTCRSMRRLAAGCARDLNADSHSFGRLAVSPTQDFARTRPDRHGPRGARDTYRI